MTKKKNGREKNKRDNHRRAFIKNCYSSKRKTKVCVILNPRGRPGPEAQGLLGVLRLAARVSWVGDTGLRARFLYGVIFGNCCCRGGI